MKNRPGLAHLKKLKVYLRSIFYFLFNLAAAVVVTISSPSWKIIFLIHFQIELDLSGNRLFSITPEAFEGLTRLEVLRLDLNRLSAIPLDALARLPGDKT